jgi:hypothetical protein
MKDAQDVIPWKVTDLVIRPYEGFWSFNPSIHFDGQLWRCVLRCCDYAMPDGVTVRSKSARPVGQQTKNAMVILDPQTWRAAQIFKMHENDDAPRQPCPHMGYEDMRIFRTDKGGLQGIAAALHLSRRDEGQSSWTSDTIPQHQPPEQVLLSFDDRYNIIGAAPIRGDGWSGTPQKNWVPFDHCAEPRFLYSINRGTMFDDRGRLHGEAARVRPSISAVDVPPTVNFGPRAAPLTEGAETSSEESTKSSFEEPDSDDKEVAGVAIRDDVRKKKKSKHKTNIRGGDVRIVRGGRVKLDTISSRPTARPASGASAQRSARAVAASARNDEAARMMGAGRVRLPSYEGLRGGSQLVRVAADAWLGLGHEMKFVSGRKFYWHTWYLVDSKGKMTAVSEPMKLASAGIEFAAGIAIEGDRVIVSFGVDDMECRLGETRLSAVLEKLPPFKR